MIDWIKTTFFDAPNEDTPIVAKWLNDFQDFCMQLGLIKDYVVDYGSNNKGYWEKWASGKLIQKGTSAYGILSFTSQSVPGVFSAPGAASIPTSFPIPFIGATYQNLILKTYPQSFNDWLNSNGVFQNDNSFYIRPWLNRSVSNVQGIVVGWEAEGRWK